MIEEALLAGALGTEYFSSDHLNNLDSLNDQKVENKIYHDRAGVNPAPTIDMSGVNPAPTINY